MVLQNGGALRTSTKTGMGRGKRVKGKLVPA
jgi:hypothetical protein